MNRYVLLKATHMHIAYQGQVNYVFQYFSLLFSWTASLGAGNI
jgi:hypothetical protein